MREIEKLKEHILKEHPRLSKESRFKFSCHKNVPCFNECCGDVNIFLTPYDIIRLKRNLGITSTEFLSKYTISPFDKNLKYPIILLKMGDDEKKKCPFVSAEGCTVYADRPWACRMYPLGLASPGKDSGEHQEEFYFLLKEDACKGFLEDKNYSVDEWLKDQGIDEYNRMGEYFRDLTTHRFFQEGNPLEPRKMEMFFLACYDIDRFRDFVFKSSFFNKFEVDEATRNKIREDDIELHKFGIKWLRLILFGEGTIAIKKDVLEAKKKELEQKNADKNNG